MTASCLTSSTRRAAGAWLAMRDRSAELPKMRVSPIDWRMSFREVFTRRENLGTDTM